MQWERAVVIVAIIITKHHSSLFRLGEVMMTIVSTITALCAPIFSSFIFASFHQLPGRYNCEYKRSGRHHMSASYDMLISGNQRRK